MSVEVSVARELLRLLRGAERELTVVSPWVTVTPKELWEWLRDYAGDLRRSVDSEDWEELFRAERSYLIFDYDATREHLPERELERVVVEWARLGFHVLDVSRRKDRREGGEERLGTHLKVYLGDDEVLVGSMNLTQRALDRARDGDEILVGVRKRDVGRIREYVVKRIRDRGRTVAVGNPRLPDGRFKVFLVDRDERNDGVVLRAVKPKERKKCYRIPIREGSKEAAGFVLDGRLYRVEGRRDWDVVDIVDCTTEVRGADEREVEEVLSPFACMRLHELDPEQLRLVETERRELSAAGSVRRYLDGFEKEFGEIRRVKRLWGVTPFVAWELPWKRGLPYSPPRRWRRLVYVKARQGKGGRLKLEYVGWAGSGERIRDLLREVRDAALSKPGVTVDLGIVETDEELVPLLAVVKRS